MLQHLMTNAQDPGGINDHKRDQMHLAVCGARDNRTGQKANKQQTIQNDNLDRLRILLEVVKVIFHLILVYLKIELI